LQNERGKLFSKAQKEATEKSSSRTIISYGWLALVFLTEKSFEYGSILYIYLQP
jgi:hypothetical protein